MLRILSLEAERKGGLVELSQILERFAQGLSIVDAETSHTTTGRVGKSGETPTYLPGVPSMYETAVADEVADWWKLNFPNEFNPVGAIHTQVPYPINTRAKCDLVFSTDGSVAGSPEWAIEVKRLQFVGDNGKKNDHNVQKMLSPYLKDRALTHDVDRMRIDPLAKRHAVIGYAFEYDFESCTEALRRHPNEYSRIAEIRQICANNNATTGQIDPLAMVKIADSLLTSLGWTKPVEFTRFSNLWRHPTGGSGVVFGWEVLPVT